MGRTRNNSLEPTRRPHSLAPSVEGWSRCAEDKLMCSEQARCTTQQRTMSEHSAAQRPAAQTGLHLGDFAASCCSVVLSGRCSYGGLRELRSTLATALPPLFFSHRPRRRPTRPAQTATHPIRHPQSPQPPALFPCVALYYSVIRLSSPICSSFCPSRTRTTHQAALSLPPCLINR